MRYPVIGVVIVALAIIGLWLLFASRRRRASGPTRAKGSAPADAPGKNAYSARAKGSSTTSGSTRTNGPVRKAAGKPVTGPGTGSRRRRTTKRKR